MFDTENTVSKCGYKSADGARFLRVFRETGNPRELRGVSPTKRATEYAPTLSRFNSSDMPRLSREQRAEVLGRLRAGQTARQAANHFNVHVRHNPGPSNGFKPLEAQPTVIVAANRVLHR